MKDKINIGSGRDIKKEEGWFNLDSHDKCGADVVHDLNKLPLPFKANRFSYVLCRYVLEDFANPIPLIEEMIRITKPGGKIEIQVAHETSCWDNLYHRRGYTMKALKDLVGREDYGITRDKIEVIEAKFYYHRMGGNLSLKQEVFIMFQKVMAFFLNLFPSDMVDYTFLKYLLSGSTIKIIYQKL